MENAFTRLLKVLALERKQGYRNKAVIGGLDKFASRWEADARLSTDNPALVGQIVALMIGYPSVEEPSARERIIDQIVRRAREAEGRLTGAPLETPDHVTGTPVRPASSTEVPVARPDVEGQERGHGAGTAREARETPAAEPEARPLQPVPSRTVPVSKPALRPGGEAEAPGRDLTPPRAKPGINKPEAGPGGLSADSGQPQSGGSQGDEGRREPAASSGPARAATPSQPTATPPLPPQATKEQAVEPGPRAGDSDSLDGWLGPVGAPHGQRAAATDWQAPDLKNVDAGRAVEEDDYSMGGWRPDSDEDEPDNILPRSISTSAMRPADRPGSGRGLDAPVTRLPGIGPSLAEKLGKIGVVTVHDLLFLLPRRYDDYSQLRTIDRLRFGEEVTVVGTIWQMGSRTVGEGRKIVTAVIGDGTGEMQATWFNPYVERQLHVGRPFVFSGKIDSYRGQLQMRDPAFEPLDTIQIHTGRLVPVYPLTQGLSGRWLRKVMRSTLTAWASSVPEPLPLIVRQQCDLLPIATALEQIHFPENKELLVAARRRLSFDEFFLLQLGVLGYRQRFRTLTAQPLQSGAETLQPYLATLPFGLTGAQQRVLQEISADLNMAHPMSRLLQGDVGSGKTAVAAAALWVAVANGMQGAIMAPTEILAEQHVRSFEKLFASLAHPQAGRPVQIASLTGRQRKSDREAVLAGLAAGDIDIAIGTHALIQDEVAFRNLAVAVVDEQHRFGVEQRAALRQKGEQPHMLVMSATPIPRSLALTVYGDLDVSVIDEMPAGRTPIKTKWLTSTYRDRAYNFIRKQAAAGHQAFIIYPLVEESDRSEAKAAVEEHARLQRDIFPDLRLGLLHGRMKGDEKDSVMRAFASGELDVLVATSVVEVGIDVPNATVIVVEGAERFGLAQLHQFRGRVGRGAYPSYCVLVSDAGEGESGQRLQALESNNDGFALAQIDLELRGPGDFLGTRQSGLPPLQMAQLSDLRTLEDARSAAQRIFARDPQLAEPEHRLLAERVAEFWHGEGDVS